MVTNIDDRKVIDAVREARMAFQAGDPDFKHVLSASILGSDLVEQIRTPVYLTDLNILYQRVSSILQREYDAIV